MSFIVKITTKIGIMDMLCPHSCRGCGRMGALICECCKNDIKLGKINYCPSCHRVVRRGLCDECRLDFDGIYMCGWRDEILGEMVEEYKYKSCRAMAGSLAEMLDEALPEIGGRIVVVPLPTIAKHIRERGFDHTYLIAKRLAKMRGWKCEQSFVRRQNTVQVGASAKKRREQATKAYDFAGKVEKDVSYLLIDDVWTTGASMRAAAKLLREAGAERIIGAVIAVSRN